MKEINVRIIFDRPITELAASHFIAVLHDDQRHYAIDGVGVAEIIRAQSDVRRAGASLGGKFPDVSARIAFDGDLDTIPAEQFFSSLRGELEFGDLKDGRYEKDGWGMGIAKVVRVESDDVSIAEPGWR